MAEYDFDDAIRVAREETSIRLKTNMDSIIGKYSYEFPESDHINLEDMSVIQDQGHVKRLSPRNIGFSKLATHNKRDLTTLLGNIQPDLLEEIDEGDDVLETIDTNSDDGNRSLSDQSDEEESLEESSSDTGSVSDMRLQNNSRSDEYSSTDEEDEDFSTTCKLLDCQTLPDSKATHTHPDTVPVFSAGKPFAPSDRKGERIDTLTMYNMLLTKYPSTPKHSLVPAKLEFKSVDSSPLKPGQLLSPSQLMNKMKLFSPRTPKTLSPARTRSSPKQSARRKLIDGPANLCSTPSKKEFHNLEISSISAIGSEECNEPTSSSSYQDIPRFTLPGRNALGTKPMGVVSGYVNKTYSAHNFKRSPLKKPLLSPHRSPVKYSTHQEKFDINQVLRKQEVVDPYCFNDDDDRKLNLSTEVSSASRPELLNTLCPGPEKCSKPFCFSCFCDS